MDCTVGVHDEVYVEATVEVPEPTQLIVCSQEGGPVGSAGATVRVESSDPRFGPLISALSEPDEPRTEGLCELWADGPAVVFAPTIAGLVRLAVPVDSCGHYQTQASQAVSDVAWVR